MPLVVIIGAGPAGAFDAESLARSGRKVVLIDEKLAWEKPSGGGITHKALVECPFLTDAQVAPNWVSGCELISPSGRRGSGVQSNWPAAFCLPSRERLSCWASTTRMESMPASCSVSHSPPLWAFWFGAARAD